MATIKRCIVAIGIAGCLAACGGSSSMSSAAASIREAEESDLGDCSFLQKVKGEGDAAASAKRAAREAAAKLGATHIKWIIPCCTSVEAEAYRCDVPET